MAELHTGLGRLRWACFDIVGHYWTTFDNIPLKQAFNASVLSGLNDRCGLSCPSVLFTRKAGNGKVFGVVFRYSQS